MDRAAAHLIPSIDRLSERSDKFCSAHAHRSCVNEGVEEAASARTKKLAHALRLVPHLRSDHELEVYSGGRARACSLTVHTAARRTTRMSERSLLGGVLQHDRARDWVWCKRAWAGAWDRSRRTNTHRHAPMACTHADSCHHRRTLDLMTLLQWRTAILGSEHALGDDDMLRIAPDAAPAPTAWYRSDLVRYTEG